MDASRKGNLDGDVPLPFQLENFAQPGMHDPGPAHIAVRHGFIEDCPVVRRIALVQPFLPPNTATALRLSVTKWEILPLAGHRSCQGLGRGCCW